MTDDHEALLTAWVDELCAALDLEKAPAAVDTVLDLAGRVAHGVVRPAAPLATFLTGYAAGLRARDDGGGPGIDREIAIVDTLLAARAAAATDGMSTSADTEKRS